MATLTDPSLRSFGKGGYQVRNDLWSTREVAISSGDSFAPRPGDLFTVQGCGVVHEVKVVEVGADQGRWNAICRLTDVF